MSYTYLKEKIKINEQICDNKLNCLTANKKKCTCKLSIEAGLQRFSACSEGSSHLLSKTVIFCKFSG